MKTSKRANKLFFSLFLALTLILSSVPTLGLTIVEDPDPVKTGNPWNPGPVGSLDNEGDVKIEKSAEITDEENEYEVTLEIKGKPKKDSEPIDIVLLLDNSGSMGDDGKLTDLKTTAKLFVQQMLPAGTQNKIGIVKYAENANEASTLTDDTGDLDTAIDGMSSGGGTFIQRGLREAVDLIESSASTAPHKFIILLSDGAPTYSYKAIEATSSGAISPEGFRITDFGSTTKGNGSNYDLNNPYPVDGFTVTNHGIATVSEAILLSSASFEIHTIQFGSGDSGSGTDDSEAKWVLKNIADYGGGSFKSASSASSLITAFNNIAATTVAPVTNGVVTDPIGPMYEYVSGSAQTSFGSVSYDSAGNGKLTWDVGTVLANETATMTYRVRLRVEDESFIEDEYYPMNGTTTLVYDDINDEQQSKDFLIPEGKGKKPVDEPWEGTIVVIKSFAGEYGDREGIEFTLVGPDGFEETKSTSNDGVINFTGLLEGEYTLTELTPSGFISSIEGGKIINLPEDADEQDYMEIRVMNRIKEDPEPEDPDVTIRKEILGDGEFTYSGFVFELIGQNDKVYGPVTTDSEGIAVFEAVEPGVYEIREILTPEQEGLFTPEDDKDITVKFDSENIFTFTNTLKTDDWKGTIRVIKSVNDRRNSDPSLSGFEFILRKESNGEETLIETKITDSSGILNFGNLEEGEYKLYESDRGNFNEGISSAGLAISLNEETSEDGIFEVEVTNTRRYPRDNDDDDDDDPEEEEEEEPEEEPEVVIVPEPTPEVPPVIVVPEPVVDAVEEVVEEVPLATLPKTGTADPMLFSGLGAALLGLGLFLKKKKEDE